MGHSVIYGKSLNFALRIVKAYQYLSDEKGERILCLTHRQSIPVPE